MNEEQLYAIEKTTLTAIGDVIREADGYIFKGDYTPENMPGAIRSNYDKQRQEGHEEGYYEGYNEGHNEGHNEGYRAGRESGLFEGYNNGMRAEQQITDGLVERTITEYTNDRVDTIGSGAFRGYLALTKVSFPYVIGLYSATFHSCSNLVKAEFNELRVLSANEFYNCSKLTTLIIRTNTAVCRLENTNAFTNTPIAKGTGFVYVPDELVDSYKEATNWSALANSIKPISEYTGG